jgi:hypothetical protein
LSFLTLSTGLIVSCETIRLFYVCLLVAAKTIHAMIINITRANKALLTYKYRP